MKKRRQPTKAQLEAQASFEALNRKWDSMPKFASKRVALASTPTIPPLTVPPGRETVRHPSRDSGFGNGTKPIHQLRYTGTKMIGIGTLHKSNAVPVFSSDEATEMARMRRG